MNYRKKNYRGKRGYSGRPHRRTADSYHQPLPPDTSRIPYARHTLTKPDVEAVVDALLSGTLTQGRELERFESLLAKLTHSEFAIAFSSGTAAIHSALACLKLEPEDEVIVPSLTFCAVANMINLVGAKVVLADCDPDTHTLSVESAKASITENTKAIFTNNFGGHPSDLQSMRELCDEHNLLLLEDASHGLGGKYRGHYVGNQADLTCFSFHPSKAITTCEGGAVTTNNRAIAEWMRQFRHHGIQKDARYFKSDEKLPAYYQELQFSGMNYRMSEIHAALGRSQLTRLDRHIDRRRSIAQVYHQKLGTVDTIRLPFVAEWADCAYHIFPIEFIGELSDRRDEIYEALVAAGIDAQVHYVPLHRMPLYSREWKPSQFPNTETYFSRCLTLPLYCDYSFKDLERVTDLLLKIIRDMLGDTDEAQENEEEMALASIAQKREMPDRTEASSDFDIPEAPQEEPSYMPPPRAFDATEESELNKNRRNRGRVRKDRSDYPDKRNQDEPVEEPLVAKSDASHEASEKEQPAFDVKDDETDDMGDASDTEVDDSGESDDSDDSNDESDDKPQKAVRKRPTRTRPKKDDEASDASDGEAGEPKAARKAPAKARTRKPAAKTDEGDVKKVTRRRAPRPKKSETAKSETPEAAED